MNWLLVDEFMEINFLFFVNSGLFPEGYYNVRGPYVMTVKKITLLCYEPFGDITITSLYFYDIGVFSMRNDLC